uniref:ATP synthase subunit e, mitochondrial n=1 Tax=Aegilops tauschii subsp. strangulata TaxID=200361 RepID=A0A453A7L9_AEGTS
TRPRRRSANQTLVVVSDPAVAAAAMPFTPGPYSGKSTLALVARVSAVGIGVVYGSVKLGILKPDDQAQGGSSCSSLRTSSSSGLTP